MRAFMELNDLRSGIIVTRDLMDRSFADEREVVYLPAWLALLGTSQGTSAETTPDT